MGRLTRIGPFMALAGATLLFFSLSQVWFEYDTAPLIRSEDPLSEVVEARAGVTGWDSFLYLDVVIAAFAGLSALVVFFDWFAPRPDGRASFTGLGVIAAALVTYPLVQRPEYSAESTSGIDLMAEISTGAWLGLAGAVLIAWGGRVDPVQPRHVYRRQRTGAAAMR